MLSRNTQPLSAGCDDLKLTASREQPGEDRSGLDDLLEVVEQEERGLLAQYLDYLTFQRAAPGIAYANALGDCQENKLRIADRAQVDDEKSLPACQGGFFSSDERETRLPDSTRTCQGHDPHAISPEERADMVYLTFSADERGKPNRSCIKRRCHQRDPRGPSSSSMTMMVLPRALVNRWPL